MARTYSTERVDLSVRPRSPIGSSLTFLAASAASTSGPNIEVETSDGATQGLVCLTLNLTNLILVVLLEHQSSPVLFPSPEFNCCWSIGACSVGIRTRVCGNSISASCAFCSPSFSDASFGFGIFTVSSQLRRLWLWVINLLEAMLMV